MPGSITGHACVMNSFRCSSALNASGVLGNSGSRLHPSSPKSCDKLVATFEFSDNSVSCFRSTAFYDLQHNLSEIVLHLLVELQLVHLDEKARVRIANLPGLFHG